MVQLPCHVAARWRGRARGVAAPRRPLSAALVGRRRCCSFCWTACVGRRGLYCTEGRISQQDEGGQRGEEGVRELKPTRETNFSDPRRSSGPLFSLPQSAALGATAVGSACVAVLLCGPLCLQRGRSQGAPGGRCPLISRTGAPCKNKGRPQAHPSAQKNEQSRMMGMRKEEAAAVVEEEEEERGNSCHSLQHRTRLGESFLF